MTLLEIIRRASEGAALSTEECEALKSFRPDESLRSELEELRGAAELAAAERDRANAELNSLRRRQQVGELAAQYQFTDPEYLAFRFEKLGVTPDSDDAATFMESLKTECPKLFKLDIRPGTATPPSGGSSAAFFASPADELARRLENAPEVR